MLRCSTIARGVSREYIFWAAGLLLLVSSVYTFQVNYNRIYHFFLVLTMVTVFLTRHFFHILFSKYMATILVPLTIVAIWALSGFGGRASQTAYMFARSVPLFFLGFGLSREPRKRDIFLFALLVGYAVFSIMDLLIFRGLSELGYRREQMAIALMDRVANYDVLSFVYILIYHFPTLSFVAILTFTLYDMPGKWVMLVLLSCHITLALTVALSTWTAAFLMLLIGAAVILVLEIYRHKGRWLYRLFLVGISVLCFNGVVLLVSGYQTGDSGKMARRVSALLNKFTFSGIAVGTVDEITGTRVALMKDSLRAFVKSPVIGVGDNTLDCRIGGHSFLADNFARYGFIGGFSFLAMLCSWLYYALYNFRYSPMDRSDVALVTFFAVLIVSNIFNPYMFRSAMDFVTFLAAGLVCGKNHALHQKHNRHPGARRIGLHSLPSMP